MNGLIGKTMAVACLAAGLAGSGCCGYYDMVDPCYPQRYNFSARTEVCGALTPQVKNGHVLDQTVWTWMFDVGTDRLNPAGLEKLAEIARRRPVADPIVYLSTASAPQDVAYDPAHPEALADARRELDNKRIASVQKYMNALTSETGMAFQVVKHDPTDPGLPATAIAASLRNFIATFGAGVGQGAGAPASGGGGAGATGSR